MASKEKQSTTQHETPGANSWGQVLANCLWMVTLLMILAFFWQSIEVMLTK